MPISRYRDLKVWQKGIDVAVDVYAFCKALPAREIYGLRAQLERAVVSVPANIAEGHGRDHLGDYLHHLSMAYGSLMEVETHLIIAERLKYVEPDKLARLLQKTDEVSRMLSALKKSLAQRATARA